jgi:DNA-binding response OmpR family regulator
VLPTRAYADNIPRVSPGGGAARVSVETPPALVAVVAETDVERFPSANFTRYPVHTTTEALRLIETARPRVVVIDWDAPGVDGDLICSAARKFAQTGVLVVMSSPETAPAALKAGCHAILLKPFAPNLVAARVGRLSRELPTTPIAVRAAMAMQQTGTNRVWPDTCCPKCNAPSATSFEFSSYRRMWYACLGCDNVWLGARQE